MTSLTTPVVPFANGKYPSPSYLEGWFDLPIDSISSEKEPIHVSLGNMSPDVYMGYLGSALSLRRRLNLMKPETDNESHDFRPNDVTKPETGNESHDFRPNDVTKPETGNESQTLCLCGCGSPVELSRTGRPKLYASSNCRVRHHRLSKK